MKWKRMLSWILVFTMVFSVISVPTKAEGTTEPKYVQAEDAEYTFKQGYSGTFIRSGATMVSSFDASKYNTPSESALTSYLDKSNTPYYAWIVEAPKEGSYTISFKGEYFSSWADCNNAGENPYVAVRVNDDDTLYQSRFMGSNGWYSETKDIAVSLKAGVNTLYAYPVTQEQKNYGSGYNDLNYNLDYIKLDGQLTAIKWQSTVVNASDAPVIYQFTNKSDGYIGGAVNGTVKNNKMYIEGLNATNISDVPSYSYYINVPQDGYYDITTLFAGNNASNTNALGVLIDGEPQVKPYNYRKDSVAGGWHVKGHHKVDVSAYMTAGIHMITITMQLPATESAAQSYTYSWTDLGPTTFSGGISVVEMTSHAATTYGMGNGYNATEGTAFGGCVIDAASADPMKLQSEEELCEKVDMGISPYVAYVIHAEKEGDYYVVPEFYGNTGSAYYMTVVANGEVSRSHKNVPAKVHLNEGRNLVYVVAFTKEAVTTLSEVSQKTGYVNQSGLKIPTNQGLTLVQSQKIELQAAASSYINKYSINGNNLGNAQIASLKNVTIDIITKENVGELSYYSYTVTAPADGTYEIAWNYAVESTFAKGYSFALMIDGDIQEVVFNNVYTGTTGVTLNLSKGDHDITIFQHIPATEEDIEKYLDGSNVKSQAWCDQKGLILYGGLTKATVQRNPLDAMQDIDKLTIKMEAENDALINRMDEPNEEATTVSGIDTTIQAEQLQSLKELATRTINKTRNAYLAFNVQAPSDGAYTIKPVYSVGTTGHKMTIVVNDGGDSNLYQCKSGQAINITLIRGNNVIYCVPFVQENGTDYSTANFSMDYLAISEKLTRVEPKKVTISSSKASFKGNWGTVTEDSLAGANTGANTVKNLNLNNASLEDVITAKASYFSYTVSVPVTGYYDISLGFNVENSSAKYFGFYIDGELNELPIDAVGGSYLANASVYLEAGEHVLTFTQHLKSGDETTIYWTDFYNLTLSGGLVRSDYQVDPMGGMSRMEAEEDASYYFSYSKSSSVNYSGYGMLGSMSSFNWDYLQSTETLKESFNWNLVPSVTYVVTAPEAGKYSVQPDYVSKVLDAFVTLRVNNGDVYTCDFSSKSDTRHNGNTVEVELAKGRNIITVITYTKAQSSEIYASDQWINHDYLGIDSRLSGVKLSQDIVTLNPGESSYIGNCSANGTATGSANPYPGLRAKLTYESVTQETIAHTIHYSFTVTAPEAGYYEIAQSVGAGGTPFEYYCVFVNGESYVGKKTSTGLYFTPYLQKGDNVLVMIAGLPKDAKQVANIVGAADYGDYTKDNNYYAKLYNVYKGSYYDFKALKLSGGLNLATQQIRPYHTYNKAEAESADATFVNKYTRNTSGVGGSYFGDAQTLKELSDSMNKNANCYVAVVVDAPATGTYAVNTRLKIGGFTDVEGSYRASHDGPQVTFMVNDGEEIVQASFAGGNAEHSIVEALVDLKAGRNVIYMIPVTKDTITIDGSKTIYADVDYIGVDSTLAIINPVEKIVRAVDSEYINLYPVIEGDTVLQNADYSLITSNKLSIETLTRRSMANVPYFSYTVNVPADGYYDITVNATRAVTTDYYGIIVDGTVYAGQNVSGSADFSLYLTTGTHTLVFTAPLPLDSTTPYANAWCNFNSVIFHGGLTTNEVEQQNPAIHLSDEFIEAENALISNYSVITTSDENLSGGKYLGNAIGDALAYQEGHVSALPQYKENAYVAFAVFAPSADEYDVALRYMFGNKDNNSSAYSAYKEQYGAAYATILVNGTVYQAEYPVDYMGWTKDSKLTVSLNAGVNIIQCLGVTSEIASKLEGAYINYDCLKIQDELSEANIDNIVIMGDANSDRTYDSIDLVRALKSKTKEADCQSCMINFDNDSDIDDADMTVLRKVLVGADDNVKTLRVCDMRGKVKAYVTAALYNGSSSTPTGYSATLTSATVKEVETSSEADTIITVNTSNKQQMIEGFGASITDTSAYNLRSLSTEIKSSAMNSLFGENGLGLTFLRQPLGASDFTEGAYYTYCDEKGLENFSIQHDIDEIIPLIKEAQALVGGDDKLHVIGTPWTAPLWMKTYADWNTVDDTGNATYNGLQGIRNAASNSNDYADDYAEYLAMAVKAYKEQGVTIDTITLQNEVDANHSIPSMHFNKNNMKKFTGYVKTAWDKYELDTKIFAYDFNWFGSDNVDEGVSRVESFMNGDNGFTYDGVAFHVYSGNVAVQKAIYDKGNKVYITEAAGNTSDNNFFNQMKLLSKSLNNGASAYIMWNVMLDQNRGPVVEEEINPIGIGLLHLDGKGSYEFTSDYYAMSHFSKYIKAGATVVDSTVSNTSVQSLAAVNKDGTTVIVLTNSDNAVKTVRVDIDSKSYEYKLPAKSAVTISVAIEE